jgi:hypothetical protein
VVKRVPVHVHVEDKVVLPAEWANHHARYASFNKNRNENKNMIPLVIFTNYYITPDDAVSVLYDNADVDDEDALPPATIAVLEHFFDGIESDYDDYESDEPDDDISYLVSRMIWNRTTFIAPWFPATIHRLTTWMRCRCGGVGNDVD